MPQAYPSDTPSGDPQPRMGGYLTPMHPFLRRTVSEIVPALVCLPMVVAGLSTLPVGDHPHAAYLYGADAGEWALNAQLVYIGALDQVDHHRGPPLLVAIAIARRFTPDLAHAGHLVNAALWAMRPFVMYALGRMCGGRLVGILAALFTVSLLPLYYSAAKFGVDPMVATMLPLCLAAVGPARRFPMWAWAAGGIAGATMVCHLSAFAYALPALLLLLWRGNRSEVHISAWARPFLYSSGLLATLILVEATFGLMGPTAFFQSLSEGVSKGASDPTAPTFLSTKATATLSAGQDGAATKATQTLLLPFLNDLDQWGMYLGLTWAGIVGLSLSPPAGSVPASAAPLPRTRRAQRRSTPRVEGPSWPGRLLMRFHALRTDLGTGLILLTALAPAPFFAASVAPVRYTDNLLPFVTLFLARGIASIVHTVGRLLPSVASRGTVAVGGLVAVCVVGQLSWSRLQVAQAFVSPPGNDALSTRALARTVKRYVDNDSAVASPIREVAVYLDRPHCPRASCVRGSGTEAFERCVSHLRQACEGAGPIPLVWVRRGPVGMGDDAFSQSFGEWAAAQFGAEGDFHAGAIDATIIAVPRSE